MKLTGELKEQVEETDSREEKKRLIEEAGMELTDEEMDIVSGGESIDPLRTFKILKTLFCSLIGATNHENRHLLRQVLFLRLFSGGEASWQTE